MVIPPGGKLKEKPQCEAKPGAALFDITSTLVFQ